MNCKQVEELLPLYAGRDLEEKRATFVMEHLQTCAACARVADEYRESIELTEQFAPPVFSDAVYAGIRQRVLREIEAEAPPSWPQTFASFFRPRLTWAIAGLLLIIFSIFAIYFLVNRRNYERQLANKPPATVPPQDNRQADIPPSVNTGENKKQLAGVSQPKRKKSRDVNIVSVKPRDVMSTASLPPPELFPPRDSAGLVEPMRVEIQTKDPKIRIIWFVQPETKPVVPSSRGI